jgi:hypothetical protein
MYWTVWIALYTFICLRIVSPKIKCHVLRNHRRYYRRGLLCREGFEFSK